MKHNRITIYLSPRRDKDIIEALEEIPEGDLSWYIRNMIREWIKMKKEGNTGERKQKGPVQSQADSRLPSSPSSSPPSTTIPRHFGTPKKIEVEDELDDLLDDL